jgi:eukaryotic-like serine/threonine-protein kinase
MSDPLQPFVSASPPAAFPPGTLMGQKYRVDGVLGWGGMGVVLRATHLELDAPVAIKVLHDELAQREEVVDRLLFEARAAARLRSRHIVRVSDVGRLESGAPYIVMELLEGADLASILWERGALQVNEAVDYIIQACEGLAEAHAFGLVHRDLKPENLFIASTPEGDVLKILDFGISKAVEGSLSCTPRATVTSADNAVGSPYYMSPEQMRASRDVDARADIWSLGAILFELLTGRCPFESDSIPTLCAQVLRDEPASVRAFASDVPAELALIVDLCLRKNANERFQHVEELASALSAFLKNGAEAGTDANWRRASRIKLRSGRASAARIQALARVNAMAPPPPGPSRRVRRSVLATVILGGALSLSQASKNPSSMAPGLPLAVADVAPTAPLSVAAAAFAPGLAEVDTAATAAPPEARVPPPVAAQAYRVESKPWRPPKPPSIPEPVKPIVNAPPSAASAAEPNNTAPRDAWNVDTWGGRY